MKSAFITLTIYIFTFSAFAQQNTTDPLQTIIDKLDSIEKRLDKLESNDQSGSSTSGNTNLNQKTKPITAGTNNTAPNNAVPKNELAAGPIALIRKTTGIYDKDLANIPADHYAGFVVDKNTYKRKEIREKSFNTINPYGMDIQGFLQAKENGRYTLGIKYKGLKDRNIKCNTQIIVNDTTLHNETAQSSEFISYVGVDLEKGIYEVQLWSSCNDYADSGYRDTERTLLIKTPSDLSLRPISIEELLHKK